MFRKGLCYVCCDILERVSGFVQQNVHFLQLIGEGRHFIVRSIHDFCEGLQASEEQLQASERENRKLEQKTEVLQSEKTAYADSIEEIQTKTTELEQKMNELETMKQDLYKQIQQLNANARHAAVAWRMPTVSVFCCPLWVICSVMKLGFCSFVSFLLSFI